MTPHYTFTPSSDFINGFTFDYVETYSFQRGDEFEENNKVIQAEYDSLKMKKETVNNLSIEEIERFVTLNELLRFTQYLINDKGHFHPSSKKTHTFSYGDTNIDKIRSIFLTEINDIPRWLCAPVYRDALVFTTLTKKLYPP